MNKPCFSIMINLNLFFKMIFFNRKLLTLLSYAVLGIQFSFVQNLQQTSNVKKIFNNIDLRNAIDWDFANGSFIAIDKTSCPAGPLEKKLTNFKNCDS